MIKKCRTSNSFIKINDNSLGGGGDIYKIVSRVAPNAQVNVAIPDEQT
jgi:hypothetical protein